MIGHYIANYMMLSPKIPAEELTKRDIESGFGDAFDDYRNKWERHSFTIQSDDATIEGEYIVNPAGGGRKKVAVIAHGITAAKEADIKYGKMFYDLGYNLVIFDERYFGDSEAPYCTLGLKESEDVKAVCAYARSVFGKDCFLCMHGESMGAAAVLRSLDTEKPDFVIADCPFSDLELLIKDLSRRQAWIFGTPARLVARAVGLKRYNFDYCRVKPIESVKVTDVPICFVHGGSDSLIKCEHSARMYKLCRNPLSELHVFTKSEHARSVFDDRERYSKIVADFSKKVEEQSL